MRNTGRDFEVCEIQQLERQVGNLVAAGEKVQHF